MKYFNLILLTAITFCSSTSQLRATHVVGGEITYEYKGSDIYTVTLSLYVDCINGTAAAILLDTTAGIAAFYGNTTSIYKYFDVYRSLPTRIKSVNYNCLVPPTNVCVDRYTYVQDFYLPDRPGGYVIAYQRCCRNKTIINVQDQNTTGGTYWTIIPERKTIGDNSSPKFKSLPPNFLCLGKEFTWRHDAIDLDGDSLYYELAIPYAGANELDPAPRPPNPPTYSKIRLNSGYSLLNMMAGNPVLKIDGRTGELTVKPDKLGQFVVGINVKEYRNGKFLSQTLRDFQFNVINCVFDVTSAFTMPQQQCDETVSFSNLSEGGIKFEWDFGDTTTTSDVSTSTNPSYVYPSVGDYRVRLISSSGKCSDTFYRDLTVRVDTGTFAGPDRRMCLNESITIGRSDAEVGISKFLWTPFLYMNDNTIPHPTVNPPVNITYSLRRTFDYCYIDDEMNVEVGPPLADYSSSFIKECRNLTVKFNNLSKDGTSYFWDFGTGNSQDTSNSKNPSFTFPKSGVYSVRLITTLNGKCSDTSTQFISVVEDTASFAGFNRKICYGDSTRLGGNVITPGAKYTWSPTNGLSSPNSPNPWAKPEKTTTYIVTRTIPECSIDDSVTIEVHKTEPFFQLAYTFPCDGLNIKVYNKSKVYDRLSWDFGIPDIDSDTSNTTDSISFQYPVAGNYIISLTGFSEGCSLTYSLPLNVQDDTASFAGPDSNLCFGIQFQLGKHDTTSFAKFRWEPPINLSNPNIPDPIFNAIASGKYVLIKQYPECTFTDTISFSVHNPQAQFTTDFDPHCDVFDLELRNNATDFDRIDWRFTTSGIDETISDTDSIFNYRLPKAGVYRVEMLAFKLHCSDTINRTIVMFVDTGAFVLPDTVVCLADSIQIGMADTALAALHFWTPDFELSNARISNPWAKPSESITYIHERRFPKCSYFDTVNLRVANPIAAFDTSSVIVCEGFQMEFTNLSNDAERFIWLFSDGKVSEKTNESQFFPFGTKIEISLQAIDAHCFDQFSIGKNLAPFSAFKVNTPNVFTPNGDGINDCFEIEIPALPEDCSNFTVTIFNRWGQIVYQKQINQNIHCWDGLNQENQVPLASGVYFYIVEVLGSQFHGTITLIR